ncbi:LysM peptidoglycan-binding domain-containing protein [Larsenimonas suaedae]|uniref:LysM peptidoglycan-binding domain-containing protein n=1 Tax=Larsenimonas suaedae TaxID=1851019 RepID=A0ABU1GVB1_9GAMM|nr:LysM peptidoglycan-binding domain-containing protein [Larsenimonas suaedae]MCM2971263.1 LysM peptidoglycan-binding domain-containing protein [Larsenimonas suaedae]MDR5895972.1 LysM peptidoglycan-binding domain-containing protein [Larsenimonas suaedae]
MITKFVIRTTSGLAGSLAMASLLLSPPSLAAPATAASTYNGFYTELVLDEKPFNDLWQRLRGGFRLNHDTDNPRVQAWITWYQTHPQHLRGVVEHARPWLRFVTRQVEHRHIPSEIALLPFVESGYNPTARHPYSGATGMWQFMPVTGDEMGLDRTWWYDGRKDVISATTAALTYLDTMRSRWYSGDWSLALAAYNAGPGTVNRAQARSATQGEPTDYWHLTLPSETMDYVPKLLALSAIVADPQKFGLDLPNVPDHKAIAEVETNGQLDLELAARLANTSIEEIRALNPGYRRWATRPAGNGPLLIPAKSKQRFERALASLPASERTVWSSYTVKSGDALSVIAQRYGTPISVIKARNQLSGNRLRAGQTLLVPGSTDQMLASSTAQSATVTVRSGDSLSAIAARNGLSTRRLARLNDLKTDSPIHPGQRLNLQ